MLDLEIEPKYHLQLLYAQLWRSSTFRATAHRQCKTESIVGKLSISHTLVPVTHTLLQTHNNTHIHTHTHTQSHRLSNNSTWAWQWLVKSWIIRFSVNLVCCMCVHCTWLWFESQANAISDDAMLMWCGAVWCWRICIHWVNGHSLNMIYAL